MSRGQILAVNGVAYSADVLDEAIRASLDDILAAGS
jgi:hypothetical protein